MLPVIRNEVFNYLLILRLFVHSEILMCENPREHTEQVRVVVHIKCVAVFRTIGIVRRKCVELGQRMPLDEFLQTGIIAASKDVFDQCFDGIGRKAFDQCVKTAIFAVMRPQHLVE